MHTDADQQTCLDLISRWMHECKTTHDICKSMTSQDVVLPARVMDVMSQQNPKLIITNGRLGKYVALSYCWGTPGPDILKLTSQNMASMTNGVIDATMFAKTHQNAFHLAQLMGVRYIWIDALCIIQDDLEDWAVESRKMGDIYGGAHLTIVAGSSADSRRGFLPSRSNAVQPCPIPLELGQDPFLFATLFPSVDEGPTASRGWCYQEAILSKRSVIFGAEQMGFRCPTGTTFEFRRRNNQTLLQMAVVPPGATPVFRPDVQLSTTRNVEERRQIVLQHWYMMLRDFSTRQLTDPGDIFASTSALAQLVARHLHSDRHRYLAGIWEMDMVRGLLWRARYQVNRPAVLKRPAMSQGSVQRAPSWSWAAVQGALDHIDFEPHGTMRKQTTSTTGDWVPDGDWIKNSVFSTKPGFIRVSPAVEVRGTADQYSWSEDRSCGPDVLHMPECELQMMGCLAKAIVSDRQVNIRTWRPRNDWRPQSQWGSINIYDGFKPRFEDALSIYSQGAYLVGEDGKDDGFAVGVFDVHEEACKNIWCLQMTEVEGLMLQLVGNEDKGIGHGRRFRRLGLFWLEDNAWFDRVEKVRVHLV